LDSQKQQNDIWHGYNQHNRLNCATEHYVMPSVGILLLCLASLCQCRSAECRGAMKIQIRHQLLL
jgi:hypothetical protein